MRSRSIPLVGQWIHRRSVGKTGDRAIGGDCEAVAELCEMICATESEKARDIALSALSSLDTPESIGSFLKEALVRNHVLLNQLAGVYCSDPERSVMKALFLFITGVENDLVNIDPFPHPLISRGYGEADYRSGQTICVAAKRNAQKKILSDIFLQELLYSKEPWWTDEEWAMIFSCLIGEARWEELSTLIFSAPIPHAINAIHAMRDSGWKPSGDDRHIWGLVTSAVPGGWTHPLPSRDPSLTIGSGDELVTRSTFSHDGAFLAAGYSDGLVEMWRVRSGTLVSSHKTEKVTVVLLIFSQDNSFLISGVSSGRITCRSTESGEIRWDYHCGEKWAGIYSLAPDGSFLVTVDCTGRIIVLQTSDGKPVVIFPGFDSPVSAIAVLPAEPALIIGCLDGSVRCVTLADRTISILLPPRDDPVRNLAVCAGGEGVLVLSTGNQPLVVNRHGEIMRTFSGFSGNVTLTSITSGGSFFAASGTDTSITVWQNGSQKPVSVLPVFNRRVTCFILSPNAVFLAEGTNTGSIRMIRIDGTSVTVWEKRRHKKGITSLIFSPDGSLLLRTGRDFAVMLWDVKTKDLQRTLKRGTGEVIGVALMADGSVIAAGYSGGTIRLYRRDTGECIRSFSCYTELKRIASDPSGTNLACAGADGSLRLWNHQESDLSSCEGSIPPPRCLAFLGKTIIVTGGWDGRLRLWNVPELKLLDTLSGHTSIITCCAVSPDERFVITGSNDTTLRIWSLDHHKVLRIIEDSRSELGAITISPDGNHFAAAGSDAIIRIYSLPHGDQNFSVPGIIGAAAALAFSPDSRILAAGYDTGTILIISCPDNRVIQTLHAHTGTISSMAITSDGRNLVTGGADGRIHVWELPLATTLTGKNVRDIALVADLERSSPPGNIRLQWGFLRVMLTARFRNAIELCTEQEETGLFDIQIVG